VNAALIALLAAQQQQQAARQQIVTAFERGGATSPAAARPLGSLGELDEGALRTCLDDGTIREGAPGTFYLYARPPASGRGWGRLARAVVFWIVLLLLPIVILNLVSR
jgi:hypothetical protein